MNNKKLAAVLACFLAGAVGTERLLVRAQAPAPGPGVQPKAAKKGNNEYLRGPSTKELIYVTLPGTLEGSPDANGNGIVVLDARNNYNFVKRIPTWDVPASRESRTGRGRHRQPGHQHDLRRRARPPRRLRSHHRKEGLGRRLRRQLLRAAANGP